MKTITSAALAVMFVFMAFSSPYAQGFNKGMQRVNTNINDPIPPPPPHHMQNRGMYRMDAISAEYTQNTAYRMIVRAANGLSVAKALSKSIKNGENLYKEAMRYYNISNKFYVNKNFAKSSHYASASFCLSATIMHIYKANNFVQLPKQIERQSK
jgi:hypothetical protein